MTTQVYATRTWRRWHIAAVLVLLLACWIEAGHVHSVLAEDAHHCVVCQHSGALEKAMSSYLPWTLLALGQCLNVLAAAEFSPLVYRYFAPIRAPPVQRPRR